MLQEKHNQMVCDMSKLQQSSQHNHKEDAIDYGDSLSKRLQIMNEENIALKEKVYILYKLLPYNYTYI